MTDAQTRWRELLTQVPRDAFIPNTVWADRCPEGARGGFVAVSKRDDPQRWSDLVAGDTAVITQVDDGRAADQVGWSPSSSSSMPSIVATMLDTLDVQAGHRVLEIGTGVGWNAALLAHRVGVGNVTSVEVDPQVAEQAQASLAAAGYGDVTVVTADGAEGYPPGAPYDRIIATCSVTSVPWAWVHQTTPGGLIVTPWGPPAANDHLLRLDVGGQDRAHGTIVGSVGFMRLRAHRLNVTDEPDDFDQIAVRSSTQLDPCEVFGNHSALAVALRLGQCRKVVEPDPDTRGEVLWLLAADAWASVTDGFVLQAGDRRLWDEALAAYQWWMEQGCPVRRRFGLTVTPDRQWVWLDDPDTVVCQLTP